MNVNLKIHLLSVVFVIIFSGISAIKPQVCYANNKSQLSVAEDGSDATSQPFRHHIRISEKKDDLDKILKKCRFTKNDIVSVHRSNQLPEDYRILPLTSYRVTFYTRTDEVDVKIYEPDVETAWLFKKRGSKVYLELVPSDLQTTSRKFKGEVLGGNLLYSIRRVITDDRVAQKFQSAFLMDFTLEQITQPGAKFEFTVEEQYYKSNFVKYGEILSLSLEINGIAEARKFVRFPRGGAYLNPKDAHTNRPLFSPVEYIRITSFFNLRRFHPIRRRYQAHRGVDFALPKGEPVYAAADGIIDSISRSRAGGKHIRILHASGLETTYEHLSAYESGLKVGDKVEAGQRIAKVGCTGFCTSAHLHFGVRLDGEAVDPVYYTRPYPFNKSELIAEFYENNFTTQSESNIVEATTGEIPKAIEPNSNAE